MDEGDGQACRWPDRPSRRGGLIVAAVGAVHAGKDLDQRRFAGTVLAEKRVDLAGTHVEINIIERQASR